MKRSTETKYFETSLAAFEAALTRATIISILTGKRRVDQRFAWATWLFTRLCVVGVGMKTLANYRLQQEQFKLYTLDSSSLAAMARNVIEATLMIHYVSEIGLSETEWTLRRTVLFLHDATIRYRMFKDSKPKDAAGFRGQMTELRKKISDHERFSGLAVEIQEKLLSGQVLYVNGLRATARKAGWDVKEFDFVYAYLSSHAHSAPVSFLRMEEHGIDFETPTDHQFGLSAFALEQATNSIAASGKRIMEIFPEIREVSPDWIDAARRLRRE